jgi:predicted TIM-barrel fold metal-dependent hydrolase
VRFVDAHHHLWDFESNFYPWHEAAATAEAASRGMYLIDDYLADVGERTLHRSVHVEGNLDPSDPVGETAWLQAIADEHGFPHGIVGYAALHKPDVQQVLEGHLEHRNFRGVRHILNWDPDSRMSQCDRPDYLEDRSWKQGFALLGRYGLTFDLQAHPWQLPQAAAVARECPDVGVVVDHLGMPIYRGEAGWETWRDGVRTLAGCANVTMKLSGFGMFDPAWSAGSIQPWIDELLDCFGPDRCMFGSNFPVDKRWKSYEQVVRGVETALRELSDAEREAVMVGTATQVYRLAP